MSKSEHEFHHVKKPATKTENAKMGRKCVIYGDQVDEELGAGAFGTVYKMNSPSGQPFHSRHPIVAVKEIRVSELNNLSLNSFKHTIQ